MGGSIRGEEVFVMDAAETSQEEKWSQLANPEVLSRTESDPQTAQPDCILPPSPIEKNNHYGLVEQGKSS